MKTLVRWECEKHSHMMLSVIKMWVIWSWITRARQWGSRGDDPIRALSRGRWLLRSFSHFPFFLKSKMLYGHDSWLRLKFTTSLQKGLFLKVKGKITSGTGAVQKKRALAVELYWRVFKSQITRSLWCHSYAANWLTCSMVMCSKCRRQPARSPSVRIIHHHDLLHTEVFQVAVGRK